jgi:hypothetical protein
MKVMKLIINGTMVKKLIDYEGEETYHQWNKKIVAVLVTKTQEKWGAVVI